MEGEIEGGCFPERFLNKLQCKLESPALTRIALAGDGWSEEVTEVLSVGGWLIAIVALVARENTEVIFRLLLPGGRLGGWAVEMP